MKRILFILSVFTLLSCKEEVKQKDTSHSGDRVSFSKDLEVTTNRRVDLLPEATAIVSQWLAYVTAQNEIEALKTSTGLEILESSNSMMQIMESLKSSIPDTISSNAVNSRVNVLLTKARILHQLSNKKEKDATEIFEVANELIVEFDNFKLQLNELFLKSPGDFEQELDKAFEEAKTKAKDSVQERQ